MRDTHKTATTFRLLARAWFELLLVDLVCHGGFNSVHNLVAGTTTRHRSKTTAVGTVVEALRVATAFYIRPLQCLHRAAAVTRLLRREGVPADMVIGCHLAPLKAHAWVEVAGDIVCENQPGLDFYTVLDRW